MLKKNNLFYIVQQNDDIEIIAKKYNINSTKILLLNNLTPYMIREGKILYIN